ncbi:MAG: DUF4856 domain-containing protein [Flavobacteriaceae bacterium]
MSIKLLNLISLTGLFLVSCSNDDDNNNSNHIDVPETYKFERNGLTTVSYSGQTCRLTMASEIYDAFKDTSKTVEDINNMFANGTGFSEELCSKNIRSKTASSATASSTVKPLFDAFIEETVNDVFPRWNSPASIGNSGYIIESNGKKRYVNSKGLELDQAFVKGLIGGLCLDQITNNYLTVGKLDVGNNISDNDNEVLNGDNNYTTMEHYWDEGFGYLYGLEADQENPTYSDNGDILLNKYAGKVNGSDADQVDMSSVYDAFIAGRTAIVNNDYTKRDLEAAKIKLYLDKIIAIRAAYYLEAAAEIIANRDARPDAFHDLSEGYGFVLSLQFTDFFTNAEVEVLLDQLLEGDGFWKVESNTLNTMAQQIRTKSNI